jgi:hypothetical protein
VSLSIRVKWSLVSKYFLHLSHCLLFPEVRFKNNGLDLIEVQDNGSGISPDNYENVGEC